MAKQRAKIGNLNMKRCAFCVHWCDPGNTVISPVKGFKDVWEYTTEVKKPCMEHNNQDRASQTVCTKFKCKL